MNLDNALQNEIFHQELSTEEIHKLDQLLEESKKKQISSQQLAVDASKLVSMADTRLESIQNTGFVKRFWNKLSGKNSELALDNQKDLVKMQRFAWHYLQRLQEQNLLNSNSIITIRNNLAVFGDSIIETRNFMAEAVSKLNNRLKRLEDDNKITNWSNALKANKRRYQKLENSTLITDFTFQFANISNSIELNLGHINQLILTLEYFGINCDEKIGLVEFVGELVLDIEDRDLDFYRELIAIRDKGLEIESSFVIENSSSYGFSALYFLGENYELIAKTIEPYENDEDFERLLSNIFGERYNFLQVDYTIRELIQELVAERTQILDLYKLSLGMLDEDGIDKLEHLEEQKVSLVTNIPSLKNHTFLSKKSPYEDKYNYIVSMGCAFDSIEDFKPISKNFINELGEKFLENKNIANDAYTLIENSKSEQGIAKLLESIKGDENKVYTWLADLFYLMSISGLEIETQSIKKIIEIIKPNEFPKRFLDLKNLIFIENEQEEKAYDLISKINLYSDYWKNILTYKEFKFNYYFEEFFETFNTASQLHSLIAEQAIILQEASKVSSYRSYDLSDKVKYPHYANTRLKVTKNLDKNKKDFLDFFNQERLDINKVNPFFKSLGLEVIDYRISLNEDIVDLDTSPDNDSWSNNLLAIVSKIEAEVMSAANAMDDVILQLKFLRNGDYYLTLKSLEEQKLAKVNEEKAEKSKATFNDGEAITINWRKITDIPFDFEKIKFITLFKESWMIVDENSQFFSSQDGLDWHKLVTLPTEYTKSPTIENVSVIDNTIIIHKDYYNYIFSENLVNWTPNIPLKKFNVLDIDPDDVEAFREKDDFTPTYDIVKFENIWLLNTSNHKSYQYNTKGLFFNKTEKGVFFTNKIYYSQGLGNEWKVWDNSPALFDGVAITKLLTHKDSNYLYTCCSYHLAYAANKKLVDSDSFVSYFNGKKWINCDIKSVPYSFPGDRDSKLDKLNEISILKVSGSNRTHFYKSENGFIWELITFDDEYKDFVILDELVIFVGNNKLTFSKDLEDFNDILIADGKWQNMSFNRYNNKIIARHTPSEHEDFFMLGEIISS